MRRGTSTRRSRVPAACVAWTPRLPLTATTRMLCSMDTISPTVSSPTLQWDRLMAARAGRGDVPTQTGQENCDATCCCQTHGGQCFAPQWQPLHTPAQPAPKEPSSLLKADSPAIKTRSMWAGAVSHKQRGQDKDVFRSLPATALEPSSASIAGSLRPQVMHNTW